MLVQKIVEQLSTNIFPEKVRNPFPWTWDTWTKMVKNDLKMTLWEALFFPEIGFFLRKKKNQRQHRRNRAQKEVPKYEFYLELIFCIVKTENRVLPKN